MLRLDVLVKRNPSMTAEEFDEYIYYTIDRTSTERSDCADRYWTYTHSNLIKGWLQRHGVYRYTQVSHPLAARCVSVQYFCTVRRSLLLIGARPIPLGEPMIIVPYP